MSAHVLHMATMGLLVAVAAPALLLALTLAAPRLDRWTAPAGVALPGFVALHLALTVYTGRGPVPPPLDTAAHLALLVGAMLFWAPVLGIRRRLPDAGRMVYLFAAIPLLDLAAVWLVAVGDSAGGLAMITGMLPMGIAAVAVTWRWISREERRARLAESGGVRGAEIAEVGELVASSHDVRRLLSPAGDPHGTGGGAGLSAGRPYPDGAERRVAGARAVGQHQEEEYVDDGGHTGIGSWRRERRCRGGQW